MIILALAPKPPSAEPLPETIQESAVPGKPVVARASHLTGPLLGLIHGFPEDVAFEPLDEEEGSPAINSVPPEILVHALRFLDHTSLERFATVNRKARLLTLETSIWRFVPFVPLISIGVHRFVFRAKITHSIRVCFLAENILVLNDVFCEEMLIIARACCHLPVFVGIWFRRPSILPKLQQRMSSRRC